MTSENLRKVLFEKFGHEDFRSGQEEIIRNIISRGNTLAVMPTGGGKSLCYQLPSLFYEGTAVVISPLIALMADQVYSLTKTGIPSAFINSTMNQKEIDETIEKCRAGAYKLIYIAPERLESDRFIENMKQFKIAFFAVDEAHCISEWGHDFRPSYMKIRDVIESLGDFPVIALTATATPEVQEDIIKQLRLKNTTKFIKGFDRPNLSYITEYCSDKLERIKEIYEEDSGGSTIIYCGTRKKVESIASGLQHHKLNAVAYHAGMQDYQRKRAQDKFISGEAKIIVATNAFGMGVDKPDVRNLIHTDIPTTLEEYYQEAGRAGRDGKPSRCFLLYTGYDKGLPNFFIKSNYPDSHDIQAVYDALYDIHGTALGKIPDKPVYLDKFEIAGKLKISAGVVESALKLFMRENIIRRGQSTPSAMIQFLASKNRISEYYKNCPQPRKKVLEAFLRSVPRDAFRRAVMFDYRSFKLKYNLGDDEIESAVRAFSFGKILHFTPPARENGIIIIKERSQAGKMPIDFREFFKRKKRAYEKLDLVFRYAETLDCKRNYILDYFNETDVEGVCGRCSSCRLPESKKKKKKPGTKILMLSVLQGADILRGMYGKSIMASALKGKKIKKITRHGLETSTAYGLAKDFQVQEIKEQIDAALDSEYLETSRGMYPKIFITEKGRRFLKENRKDPDIKEKEEIREKPETIEIKEADKRNRHDANELYHRLDKIRREIAYEEVQTPLSLISDAALRQIAGLQPLSIKEMMEDTNCSSEFALNFGKRFISEIRNFMNGIKSVYTNEDKPENKKAREITPAAPLKNTEDESKITDAAKLDKKGGDLDTLASQLVLTRAQAAAAVEKNIENGVDINIRNYIDRGNFKKIYLYLKKHPDAKLSEIMVNSGAETDYPVLRIAAAHSRKHLKKSSSNK